MTDPASSPPARPRPDIREILRPRPEEEAERRAGRLAAAAMVVGPALVIAAIAVFFVPFISRFAFPIALILLVLAPGVVSLGWRPGGSPNTARWVAAGTAILLGLAVGGLGFLANPCVSDPTVVGVAGGAVMAGTFLVATAIGRPSAMQGHVATPIVVAGAVALVGFGLTLLFVLSNVFVLC